MRERQQRGLHPLTINATLARLAGDYGCEMIDGNYFEHTDPTTGSTVGSRALAAGYYFKKVGENLAGGFTSPEETMTQWMDSPGHRAQHPRPGLHRNGRSRPDRRLIPLVLDAGVRPAEVVYTPDAPPCDLPIALRSRVCTSSGWARCSQVAPPPAMPAVSIWIEPIRRARCASENDRLVFWILGNGHSKTFTCNTPLIRITRRFVSTYSRLAHWNIAAVTRTRPTATAVCSPIVASLDREAVMTQPPGQRRDGPARDQPRAAPHQDEPQRRLDRQQHDLVPVEQALRYERALDHQGRRTVRGRVSQESFSLQHGSHSYNSGRSTAMSGQLR